MDGVCNWCMCGGWVGSITGVYVWWCTCVSNWCVSVSNWCVGVSVTGVCGCVCN